jgi:hypothetical protein
VFAARRWRGRLILSRLRENSSLKGCRHWMHSSW